MIKTNYLKRLGIGALSLLLGMSVLPAEKYADTAKAIEDTTIEAPALGNTVTWDCIYFGSYPQGEITETMDRNTYQILQSSKDWKSDNTLTIDDTKYKRIKKEDATSTGSSYTWSTGDTYHYFKFEPIKWRVMDVTNHSAYLISDVALDVQKYNQEARDVSWNTSSLRSWLNGYDRSKNQAGMDYSSNNFMDTAFGSNEKDILVSTNSDKITILSEEELKNTTGYGFHTQDSRTCKASAYAQAMGAHPDSFGSCNWWTSDSGNSNLTAKYVQHSGDIYTKGYSVAYAGNVVRVAVTINLTQPDTYRYAGTVSSDGTVMETVSTKSPDITPTVAPDNTQTVQTENPPFTTTPTATLVPTQTANATATAPTQIPNQTTIATTTAPTMVPAKTTTATTAVPSFTPDKTTTAASTAPTGTSVVATTAPTTNEISKGSVWYHTNSNAQYRVIKRNKSAGADGTVGTVAYLGPIKTSRTSATIPAKVTIENYTFKVTTIANSAFAGNKKLKKVVIGKNIKHINKNAFKGCKKLKKITIQTTGLTKSSIGKNAFKNINAKAAIKVPRTKLKKYKKYLKAAGAAKTVVFRRISSK